ncbi:MAG TPA: hypothetical protein VM843_06615 [Flavisolibacter sp.]|nr:hypothetical protein [Flavisolibacter sp.]
MKRRLHFAALILATSLLTSALHAQEPLSPDQNPSFAVSRDKYLLIADSLTSLHSTTIQSTYKAYDWYEAQEERRAEQRAFNRQLQLERLRTTCGCEYDCNHSYRNRYNRGYSPYRFW